MVDQLGTISAATAKSDILKPRQKYSSYLGLDKTTLTRSRQITDKQNINKFIQKIFQVLRFQLIGNFQTLCFYCIRKGVIFAFYR